MKRILIFSALLILLVSLACRAAEQVVFGTPTPTPSQTPNPTLTLTPPPTATAPLTPTPTAPLTFGQSCPNGDCIEACVKELGIALVNESPYSHLDPNFEGKGGQILAAYHVDGSELEALEEMSVYDSFKSYQQDTELHARIWKYYTSIIPYDYRRTLQTFLIFTDGKQRILAYVSQSRTFPREWALSVDVVDAETPQDLTYTLVHEFAHLLTLGPDQVPPSDAIFANPDDSDVWRSEYEACQTYFPGTGCSLPKSYINVYYDRFWPDVWRDWLRAQYQEDNEVTIKLLEEFYEIYLLPYIWDQET